MRFHKALLAVATLAGLLSGVSAALAQTYPTKPVKMIVPFAPGGRVEAVARILADALSKDLGQPFLVESRAGAGGSIGADFVAKSAPDGHTLLLSSAGVLAILPNVDKKLPFDPAKDFTPVARLMEGFTFIGAYPGLPVKTIAELTALAKQKPDTLGYASSGIGTYSHLAGELLKIAAGAPIKHIPYRGSGPALNDIVAGHVALMIGGELGDLAKAGKIRILATTNEKRSPEFPDVPTMKESGFPQFVAHSWIGLAGPAKMDKAIGDKLNVTLARVIADPATQDKLRALGGEPSYLGAEGFGKQITDDIAIYAEIIAKAGLKFE
jgi:tripartite-type tricarboxylate transporter receptor subunit TctC